VIILLLVMGFLGALLSFQYAEVAVAPFPPLLNTHQDYAKTEEVESFYPHLTEYRRHEDAEKILVEVCRQVWIEARRAGCPDADDPAFVWRFLTAYGGSSGTIGQVVASCTPSPVFSCYAPEQFGCYLLKRTAQPYDESRSYFVSDLLSYPTTDPCAFAGVVR